MNRDEGCTLLLNRRTLAYSCLVGFSIDDADRIRRCLRDGTWSGRDEGCTLSKFTIMFMHEFEPGCTLAFG